MDLPIRMLLVVILLAATAATGYSALDAHLVVQEKIAANKAVESLLLKAQIVGMGASGSRETLELVLKGHSKLALRNENFSGDIRGVAKVDLTRGGNVLKVLPLALWDFPEAPSAYSDFLEREIVYHEGAYWMTMTHRSVEIDREKFDYIQIE
ncbi:MAG: hypothetical protein V3T58_03095 [Candidatus Hydrothermarchaeales archaeon]